MATTKLSDALNAASIKDGVSDINGSTYAVTAADHEQTRCINQAADLQLTFSATLKNGLKGSFWRRKGSTGAVTWASPDGALFETAPDGGGGLDVGILTWVVKNPTGTAATVLLVGSFT